MTLITRPTVLPQFASDDVLDPIQNLPNVAEPPLLKKQQGWMYKEAPPSNWFNWLHRYTYRWLSYFDDQKTNVTPIYAVDTGTINNIVITLAPAPSELVDGRLFCIKMLFSNTGACTLNVNNLGSKSVLDLSLEVLLGNNFSAGSYGIFIYSLSNDAFILQQQKITNLLPISNYNRGMLVSPNTTTPTTSIDITTGYFVSDDTTQLYNMTTALTKNVTLEWTKGNLGGALPKNTTIAPHTWYNVFAIASIDGSVDVGIDTNINATNLLVKVSPYGYNHYRLIGNILTDASSHIIGFYMTEDTFGRKFFWKNPPTDLISTSGYSTPTPVTISTPLGIKVNAYLSYGVNAGDNGGNYAITVYDLSITTAGMGTNFSKIKVDIGSGVRSDGGATDFVVTNATSQVGCYRRAVTGTIFINTWGWIY